MYLKRNTEQTIYTIKTKLDNATETIFIKSDSFLAV